MGNRRGSKRGNKKRALRARVRGLLDEEGASNEEDEEDDDQDERRSSSCVGLVFSFLIELRFEQLVRVKLGDRPWLLGPF